MSERSMQQQPDTDAEIDANSIHPGTVFAADASRTKATEAVEQRLPEVEVFEHRDFKGDRWRTSFGYKYVGSDWNDRISSIIVYSGYFEFFEHRDFGGASKLLSPGHYAFVGDYGIANDTISSWKAYYE